jgi:glucosamine--fructose-6-phosphate aminotransferase (isomerizing)
MTALEETIAAQGDLLESVLRVDVGSAAARIEPAPRIWLVGTGTSQHAAELGATMFAAADADVRWASAAGFAWGQPRLTGDDAVVVISHTTETAFAQRARRDALEAGARVVSITGRERGWPEAIETVAAERSETYTASYTAALVVLARLASELGRSTFDAEQLGELPDRVRRAAREGARLIDAPPARAIVLAGAGPAGVTAREGALKLREAAGVLAEGYEAEYLLHGSAVPLGAEDALLAIQPGDARSGLLAAIAEAAAAEGLAVTRVEEPAGLDPVLAQVPLTVRLQALASRLADDRGVDPDTVIRGAWADEAMWRIGAPEA